MRTPARQVGACALVVSSAALGLTHCASTDNSTAINRAETGGTGSPAPTTGTSGGAVATAKSGGAPSTPANSGGAPATVGSGGNSSASTGGNVSSATGGAPVGSGGSNSSSLGGGNAGPLPCTSLVCEDFESSDTLDTTKWKVALSAGMFEVQKTHVAHGKNAAHFHVDVSDKFDYSGIILQTVPDSMKTHFYGRAYFYATPDVSQGHTRFINAGNFKSYHAEIGSYQDGWQLTSWDPDEHFVWGGTVPITTFTCIQFEFGNGRGSPGKIAVTVAGDSNNSAESTQPNVPDFSEISFGFWKIAAVDHVMDVYFDDIALDTSPVPCMP